MKRTCFKSDFYDISYLFQIKVIKHSSSAAETVEIASTKSGSTASERLPSMFMSLDECVNIGLDCIYSYESDEESELIVEMAQFLKKKCMASRNFQNIILEEIDDILDIMKAIRLLRRYNIVKTLHYFKVCKLLPVNCNRHINTSLFDYILDIHQNAKCFLSNRIKRRPFLLYIYFFLQ